MTYWRFPLLNPAHVQEDAGASLAKDSPIKRPDELWAESRSKYKPGTSTSASSCAPHVSQVFLFRQLEVNDAASSCHLDPVLLRHLSVTVHLMRLSTIIHVFRTLVTAKNSSNFVILLPLNRLFIIFFLWASSLVW